MSQLPADVAAKVKPGHVWEDDPPWGLSRMSRWTCSACDRAVLRHPSTGHVYGSATEEACTPGVSVYGQVQR